MTRTARIVAKTSFGIAAGVGLFVGTHALLAGITESYRVFGNDILPSLGTLWGGIRHFETYFLWMFCLPAILLVLSLLTGLFVVFKPRWALVPFGALVVCFLVSIPVVKRSRLYDCVMSCCNHANFVAQDVAVYMMELEKQDPSAKFPVTTEMGDIFAELVKLGWIGGEPWEINAISCPGRTRAGSATGYVFVGGGLPVRLAEEKHALLAFCAAECHPPPFDIQHAFFASGTRERCATARMIEFISEALRQARTGEVPYSAEAIALLRSEKQKRDAWVKPPAQPEKTP